MTASLISAQRSPNKCSNEHRPGLRSIDRSHRNSATLHLVEPEGQIQVHTAPYRGSFSGVMSESLRAAGLGRQVMVAQFLKGGVDQGPDGIVRLCGRLEWLRPKISLCLTEQASSQESTSSIEAVNAIWKICKNRLLTGNLDQLVLDEIGLAISLGYLKEDDLISTLEQRPKSMDVILTGPSIPLHVIAMADQVTQLRCGF